MNCSKCGGEYKIIDSRDTGNNETRRRRKCLNCGDRITTYEINEDRYGQIASAKKVIRQFGKLIDFIKKYEAQIQREQDNAQWNDF